MTQHLKYLFAVSFFFGFNAGATEVGSNNTSGKLDLHNKGGHWILVMPDSLFNRNIMVISRLTEKVDAVINKAPIVLPFAGTLVNSNVIKFEKTSGGKCLIKHEIIDNQITGHGVFGVYKAAKNTDSSRIFQLDDSNLKGSTTVSELDVTSLLISDCSWLFIERQLRDQDYGLVNYSADRSSINEVNVIGNTIEIASTKIYVTGDGTAIALKLLTTLLFLPKKPMEPRSFDPRVGYYSKKLVDSNGTQVDKVITRYRLEPREKDLEKYFKGQLVEPRKPIVYFIDPSTPEWLVPYFNKGVNNWQTAFERAGFKNAIVAKRAPTKKEDPTWSLYSGRHSAVVFQQENPAANSTYSNVVDPRSGEILESHVLMYGGIFRHDAIQYLIQASPSDARARKAKFDNDLVGQIIQVVVSHEVGHSLGFPHNMGSSSSIPVEKLRDRNWLRKNSIAYSIMDYARNNYIAQPEDHIDFERGLTKIIGEYDKWAIEWGYRLFEATDREIEKVNLRDWITKKNENSVYWYGGEESEVDPRVQEEDLGNDALLAGKYAIQNLKFVVNKLVPWMKGAIDTTLIAEIYNMMFEKFSGYMDFVRVNIGGIYENSQANSSGTIEKGTDIAKDIPVPFAIQKKAVDFLVNELFITPEWLRHQELINISKIDFDKRISQIKGVQLSRLINQQTLANIISQQASDSSSNYTVSTYFDDWRKVVWRRPGPGQSIDTFSLKLQTKYIDLLALILRRMKSSQATDPVVLSVKGELEKLNQILVENLRIHDLSEISADYYRKAIAKIEKLL